MYKFGIQRISFSLMSVHLSVLQTFLFACLGRRCNIIYVLPGTYLSQIKYAHADFNQIMKLPNNLAEKSIT